MLESLRRAVLRDIPREDERARAMRELSRRLAESDERFNQERDDDLIEACIYERLSLEAQYRYLLRCAKADAARQPVVVSVQQAEFAAPAGA